MDNVVLLADRLSKLYGKNNAKQIMHKHKDNLFGYHGVAYWLGKRDLYFFNMYFLQNVYTGEGKSPLAPIHHTMWETMQNMYVEDTHDQQAFILPRGIGKSLTGSVSIALWANLYGYSPYTVVASAVQDTAQSFIRNIRGAIIDNPRIEMAFGKMYDPNLINASDRIELANKTMIQALSSRSSFRGKSYLGNRISLLILDDFQSEENVTTKEQMEKHWKKFSDDSANAIEKNNYKMIAMGTIITQGDFYDRLLYLPTWKHIKEKAVQVDDVDKLFSSGLWGEFKEILFDVDNPNRLDNAKEFYYENEEAMQYPLLWQSYWDCLEMALQYYENPTSFKQELQLEVDGDESIKFKHLHYYNKDNIDYEPSVLVVDPATSDKATADYHAFVVGGIYDDIIYVDYAHIDRFNFDDYIQHMVTILRLYKNIDTVVIEKQTYNGADVTALKNVMQRDDELAYRNIEFINNHQTKNKDNKIDSIVGDVNMGRIQFNLAYKNSEAIEQLKTFKSTKSSPHDDFPDALSELAIYLKENNLQANRVQLFDIGMLF